MCFVIAIFVAMSFSETVKERMFFINNEIVFVSNVQADDALNRIIVDSFFRGYLKKIDDKFTRAVQLMMKNLNFFIL